MKPLNMFRRQPRNSASQHNFTGAESFRTLNPGYALLNGFCSDGYDSAYPSISAISKEFMTIRPFAVDAKGKRVENNEIINALYHPNKADSSVAFFEKLAVSALFHRNTYLLVWRRENGKAEPGGNLGFKGKDIAGFTFLEFPGISRRDGKTYYNIGSQEFSEDEVLVIPGGVHPNDLYGGYSPSVASFKWGKLDDFIADYQSGFFQNNAIPAGQFIITAPTPKEYNDIVDKMEQRHRGAGKNNNVTYTHRPVDAASGKPVDAQIEWIPFSQSNKDIDFKNLFEQVNKRIDLAYGVPQIVKGVDDAATYANAQVAEAGFAKRAVRPLALRIYTQITHELNRITGGLGIAITFDYDIPAVADEELVRAQTKQIEATTIQLLTGAGYSLESVIDAFGYESDYKDLKLAAGKPKEGENTDVDEGDEVDGAPDPEKIDGVTPVNKKSKVVMQTSSRDFPDLYEGTGIDPQNLGCIMVDVKPLQILSVVGDGAKDDLITETDRHEHQMGAVAEVEPHVTLLYGLLENGNVWKDKVDSLLEDWSLESITVREIGYFDLPESYAVVAHIEETTDLLDGHDRLTLLPHINTFSEYRPHMTLAYISKDADLGKWLTTLNKAYAGSKLAVTGLNYGKLPEDDDNDTPADSIIDPKAAGTIAEKIIDKTKKQISEAANAPRPKAQLKQADVESYEAQLSVVVRDHMSKQIENYIAKLDAQDAAGDPTDDETDDFTEEMLPTIVAVLDASGDIQHTEGLSLVIEAGFSVDDVTPYNPTDDEVELYRKYLKGVAGSYGDDTGASIRAVLERSQVEGWTRNELESQLRNIMNTDEWRVKRLASSEVNRSQDLGSVYSMRKIQDESGVTIERSLLHTGGDPPCQYCAVYIDKWLPIEGAMIAKNSYIVGADGGIIQYTWDTNDGHDVHANGHCVPQYRVRK